MPIKLYLNIPYAEKEEAKSLGARWDASIKKWYYDGPAKEHLKFAKWIVNNAEYALIAREYIHILEGSRICFRCGKETTVIALGIGEHHVIYINEDNKYDIYIREDLVDEGELIHLSWVDKEEDTPLVLLMYLKEHYTVKTGNSQIAGECFANHCQHCGVIQGNNYIMDETDSPLSVTIADCKELKARISRVKIKSIPINDNIQLNWTISYSDNDYAYLRYGSYEEIIIAPSGEEWISYKEMYGL